MNTLKKLLIGLSVFVLLALPAGLSFAQVGSGPNTFTQPSSGSVTQGVSSGNIGIMSSGLTTGSAGGKDLNYLINLITALINRVIPLIFAMAVVVILWGIAQSVSGSDEKRSEGKLIIVWGIIGLFAMLSIWGLVNILVGTFQLDNNPIKVPRVY